MTHAGMSAPVQWSKPRRARGKVATPGAVPKRRRVPIRFVDAGPVAIDGAFVAVDLPLRVVSEGNKRGHWARRAERTKQARGLAQTMLRAHAPAQWDGSPLAVILTRIAPCKLDDDNLRASLKATRDGVADWLGIDDRDARVRWLYDQERAGVRTYGVRVHVTRDP